MDLLLGLVVSVFLIVLLLYSAIRDVLTREVTNWVWGVGLFGLPVTIFRMVLGGLFVPYVAQFTLVLLLALLGFRLGILGGADGKAIILISLVYPWILVDFLWLVLAPLFVMIGGFIIIWAHTLFLLIQNKLSWNQHSKNRNEKLKPEKKIYWVTRRLTRHTSKSSELEWKPVVPPLILYFLLAYIVLLIFSSGLILVSA